MAVPAHKLMEKGGIHLAKCPTGSRHEAGEANAISICRVNLSRPTAHIEDPSFQGWSCHELPVVVDIVTNGGAENRKPFACRRASNA